MAENGTTRARDTRLAWVRASWRPAEPYPSVPSPSRTPGKHHCLSVLLSSAWPHRRRDAAGGADSDRYKQAPGRTGGEARQPQGRSAGLGHVREMAAGGAVGGREGGEVADLRHAAHTHSHATRATSHNSGCTASRTSALAVAAHRTRRRARDVRRSSAPVQQERRASAEHNAQQRSAAALAPCRSRPPRAPCPCRPPRAHRSPPPAPEGRAGSRPRARHGPGVKERKC